MTEMAPAYGLWFLVVVNSAIFILFAYSFFKRKTTRDWRQHIVENQRRKTPHKAYGTRTKLTQATLDSNIASARIASFTE